MQLLTFVLSLHAMTKLQKDMFGIQITRNHEMIENRKLEIKTVRHA